MKIFASRLGIILLGLLLGLGTSGVLLYVERSAYWPAESTGKAEPPLPQRLWSFKTSEVDSLIVELKKERENCAKRERDMDETASHLEAERQELEKVRGSIKTMRDDLLKEITEMQDAEIKNLKSLSQTYSNMSPSGAVAIFREMDDATIVKVLALMKPDKIGSVLEEMAHAQDKDGSTAKRAARISDKLRLVKPLKKQAPLP